MNLITNIKNWLKRPYFFNESLVFKLTTTFGLSTFIASFLFFFEPFGIRSLSHNFNLFCIGVGVSIAFVIGVYFWVFHPLFPKYFTNNKWTVGREIFTLFSVVVLSAVCIWLFNQFVNDDASMKGISALDTVLFVLKVSFLPIVIYLFIDEKYSYYQHSKVSKDIMSEKKKDTIANLSSRLKRKKRIELTASNEKDTVSFNVNDLLYVTSQGNYVSFFVKEKENVKEKVLRSRLQIIEERLKQFPQIIRCHKSYIVNSDFVKDITGNARGYYLHFSEIEGEIPVSRSFDKEKLSSLVNSVA